ncbi:NAD-binding oxidoreductase [Nostocoides japonicum T1-X7]|uniref:NAD-binding oxidoreductase n=1 Tax=Nostocoides japonicum T1-X7 TaxID=1194083 RepID=A0A077LY43_9MICO|nr:Gfo/Idh/MocA family oxidoreductase [Tetrasphaera japonica]CCH77827.1 NAD-binding oxidoreductase [Tetrasphaera japonica T1-X7]
MDATSLERFGRRLRVAMIGGGLGSYIGETHRIALRCDGLWELVAGAFSRDYSVCQATGRRLLLDPERVYRDHRALVEGESRRADRVDAVIVATRPATHAEIIVAVLDAGFHVISEKPLTSTLEESVAVAAALARSGKRLMLTHCYSGYPMIRMAREMVERGDLGRITAVDTEFASGAYAGGTPEGAWRVGSAEAGDAGMLVDLGTHALQLATYVTGARVSEVSARLDRLAPEHEVYDNAFLDLGFEGGAVGRCWSTYQAAGAVHGLRIAVYGDRGSIAWDHERAEVLWWRPVDGPETLLTKAGPMATAGALAASRFTAGHPDGYGLAFANLYRDFAEALMEEAIGEDPAPFLARLPGVEDGIHTLEVIDGALRSHAAGHAPVPLPAGPGSRHSVGA